MAKGMLIQLKVVNAKRMSAKLLNVADGLRGETLLLAAKVGALPVEAEATRLVPVGATGQLKRSIRQEVTKAESNIAIVSVKAGGQGTHGGRPIARFVEFGTSRTPAQPFLRPALKGQRGAVLRAVRGVIGSEMRRRFGI